MMPDLEQVDPPHPAGQERFGANPEIATQQRPELAQLQQENHRIVVEVAPPPRPGGVGVEHLAHKRFGELSGGQRQRTLIARALAAAPELLALDEPTSGMDPAAELALMDLLRDLNGSGGLAVVMVSHRLEAVANYARALAFVDKDQGLFRVGSLDEMLRPEALGALYGRAVAVREEAGRRLVYPLPAAGEPR